MKLTNAKYAVYALTVAGLLFTVGLAVFLIVPTFAQLRQLGDKIVHAQTDLEAQYENRKKLIASAAEAEKVRSTMTTLASQFVPPGGELDLITGIEEIATRNGVKEDLTLNRESLAGAAEVEVGFDLSMTGPYHRIMQTIVELERMPTLVIFKSANFRPGSSMGADTPVTVVLHGSVAKPPRGL